MPNTMTLIASYTVSGTAATIDFSSIPSTYTDLVLLSSLRSNQTDFPSTDVLIKYNNTASNQSQKNLRGYSLGPFSQSGTDMVFGNMPSAANTTSTFSSGSWYIPNYAGAINKSASYESAVESNGSDTYSWWLNMGAELWSDTTAINRITLTPSSTWSFAANSTAYLYGIKNS